MPEFIRILITNALRRRAKIGIGAAIAVAAAVSAIAGVTRAEAFDDPLSAESLDRLIAARSREVLTGRATPIERLGQNLTIGHQPPQNAGVAYAPRRAPSRSSRLLASVGKDDPIS